MERHNEYIKRKAFEVENPIHIKLDVDSEVDHPIHYNQSGIECIDAISAVTGDGMEHYLQGNIIKYLWRYRYKNGLQDLKKADWYLKKLISIKESEGE
mgnify:FL=1|jgi:hypothetical protein|tara:strand:- start:1968 stop:2261 length:294 start_codon:yes stop_codon:yes gene_type:complete